MAALCAAAAMPALAANRPQSTTRHYYIAAEDVVWDFAPTGQNLVHCHPELGPCAIPEPWTNSHVFPKVRYIEYTDATFTQRKTQPEWLGILGPVIRAQVGDTVIAHFCNHAANGMYGMHPHGFRYDKDSEGSFYRGVDGGQTPGSGAEVEPGSCFDYTWAGRQRQRSGPWRSQLEGVVVSLPRQ
jgi:FtsP/CotA-like multicopper oxidase with cupredoxin domain